MTAKLSFNPFPVTATISLQGVVLNFWVNPQPIARLPTYEFPWVEELRHVVQNYLSRRSGTGNCILLQGPHGSGKTHTIRCALTEVRRGPTDVGSSQELPKDSPAPVLLYSKVEGFEFAAMWRGLVSELKTEHGLNQLRAAGQRALRRLVPAPPNGDLMSPDFVRGGSQIATDQDPLAPSPINLDFLNDIRIRRKLWANLGGALEAAADWKEDFSKAFEYLFAPELQRDSHLARTARNWLIGEQLTEEQLQQLGVARSLTTCSQALASIRFLVRLFHLAEIPLILTIDQGERLLDKYWQVTDEMRLENCKALHTLAEIVPRDGALLILAGTGAVSSNLTVDLRARFSQTILCDPLHLVWAKKLLESYLQTARDHGELPPGDSPYHPFDSRAVKALLVKSRANIRRFLQAASQAMARWTGQGNIDRSDVERLPVNQGEDVTERDVLRKIESVLSPRGWFYKWEQSSADRNSREDLVLYDNAKRARATLEISRAAFRTEEALRAVDLLQHRQGNLPLIVIYTGYATPDVVNLLRKRATVILYDETSFDQEVGDAVDELARIKQPPPIASEPPPPPAPPSSSEPLSPPLQTLIDQARSYEQSLGVSLRVISNAHAQVRRDARWREARAQWNQEQARIKDQIREGRRQRQQEELAELRNEALNAEQQRSKQMWSRTISVAACLATLGILLGFLAYQEAMQISEGKPTDQRDLSRPSPPPMGTPSEKTSTIAFLLSAGNELKVPDANAAVPPRAAEVVLMPVADDEFAFELHSNYDATSKNAGRIKTRVTDANKKIAALPATVREKSIGLWPQDLATLEADLARAEGNQKHRTISDATAAASGFSFLAVAAVLWLALSTFFFAWNPLVELAQPVSNQGELERRARAWWKSRNAIRYSPFDVYWRRQAESFVRAVSGRSWMFVPPTLEEMVRDRNPNFRYAALQTVIESSWQAPEAREALAANEHSSQPRPSPAFPGPVDCLELAAGEQVPCVRRAFSTAAGAIPDQHHPAIYRNLRDLTLNRSDAPYFIEAIARFRVAEYLVEELPDITLSLVFTLSRIQSAASFGEYMSVFAQLFEASDAEVLAHCLVTGRDPDDSDFLLRLPDARLERAVTLFSWNEGLGRYDYLRSICRIDEIYLFLRRLQYYQTNSLLFVPEGAGSPAN